MHDFVLAPEAESAVASIQGGDVDPYALAAGREDEGAAVFETAWEALRSMSLRGLSPSLAKAP
ncbi:MAG: hypothetical protein ABI568_08530 [Pseudarthrobacter sp.]